MFAMTFFFLFLQILLEIRRLLGDQPTMVEIDVPAGQKFTICGDVHGQFYDLCNIFDLNGLPSEENPYVSGRVLCLVFILLFCYVYEMI